MHFSDQNTWMPEKALEKVVLVNLLVLLIRYNAYVSTHVTTAPSLLPFHRAFILGRCKSLTKAYVKSGRQDRGLLRRSGRNQPVPPPSTAYFRHTAE